jgi:hypothetical protein
MWMIDEAWQGKIDSYGGIALPGFPTCSCQLKGHLAAARPRCSPFRLQKSRLRLNSLRRALMRRKG